MDSDENTLTISDVQVDDAGMYTVKAHNKAGVSSQSVGVNIQDKAIPQTEIQESEICPEEQTKQQAGVKPIPPTSLTKLQPVIVDVGETVLLKCQFQGEK